MKTITNLLEQSDVEKTDGTRKLTIKGITKHYPVYRIPLDRLYYNDKNGRIATYISQYKSQGKVLDRSCFESYNIMLHDFIYKSNPKALKETKENIKNFGQRLPGVVLQDGRVIDGNRRFTCLRELKSEGEDVFFEAVILDESNGISERDIKLLELNLQHGEERPVDYNSIDYLVDVYNDLVKNKVFTIREYTKYTNKKQKDVEMAVNKAKLMVQYLNFINAKEQYYLAREMDLDGPLQEMVTILKKDFKGEDFMELDEHSYKDKNIQIEYRRIRNALFTAIFTNRSNSSNRHGDLTRYIREIGKTVIHGTNRDDFLEKYEDVIEEVFDTLHQQDKVTLEAVKEVGKELEKVRDKGTKIINDEIIDTTNQKNQKKPVEALKSALKTINHIDQVQVKRLTGIDKQEFDLIIAKINDAIKKLG